MNTCVYNIENKLMVNVPFDSVM